VVRGVAPNELTDSRARDPFAGTPWHKCVPARAERVALVGRNGTGKSSLLRLLAGDEPPDSGTVWRADRCVVAHLPQEVPRDLEGGVVEVVAAALGPLARLVEAYETLTHRAAHGEGESVLEELAEVQHRIEQSGAWDIQRRVDEVLTRLSLDPERRFEELSGGLKRRVLLARALVTDPQVLLLDEPTNHLDIDAIEWLEAFLLRAPHTLLFVTHDRGFLARLATRIVELDRGKLTSYPGSYERYLAARAAALEAEERAEALFDKKLSQEEAWVRQGIKARRTRNEGRVKALEKMRADARDRRKRIGNVRMETSEAERSGQLVARAQGVTFRYDGAEAPLFRDLDVTILRGDRVAVIGPNGSGKTTLLKLLLGGLEPTAGRVKLGTNLQVAYFDQTRDVLDPEASIAANVGDGKDVVEVGGKPRHIIGYLRDFLFPAERAQTPVKALSGGERNRVLLAKLFARPANLLVMDEPTNDLDVETLELLEDLLVDYRGTLLLVSHDRVFLNHVVTSTLVLEGEGRVVEYAGGYDDWLAQRPVSEDAKPAPPPRPARKEEPPRAAKERKLSFKEKQELAALPERIERLEAEKEAIHARFADPTFFRSGADEAASLKSRVTAVEAELEAAYARWNELDQVSA
jgi:ATP-binding cassette subfamily F protein uup